MSAIPRTALVLLVCCPTLLLTACGEKKEPVATTTALSSDSYSCTGPALARMGELKRVVAAEVPHLTARPRIRNYCDGGLQASVEFTLKGTVADVASSVRSALSCGATSTRPGATGRTTVMTCSSHGMTMQTTLAPYLPADDPRGPTSLGDVTLVKAR